MDFFPLEEKLQGVRLGTSSFTATGWLGSFYPSGLKTKDYLSYYSQHFDAVEVDSTFYGTPSEETLRRWVEQTPPNFKFAAKAPQLITHTKCMLNCREELLAFIKAMDNLGGKLGPLLFQFPYFGTQGVAYEDFLDRLEKFIRELPEGYQFAFEIRNKNWIEGRVLELLKEREIALALIAHPWMWSPSELFARVDPMAAPFTYVRLLGDRYEVEQITKRWDKVIIDRETELMEWAQQCLRIQRKGKTIYVFANNHYAGHGPATLKVFRRLYQVRFQDGEQE